MGTSKRQRQKQARQARREASAAARRKARARRRAFNLVVLVVLFVLVALAFSALTAPDGDEEVSTGATTTTAADGTTTTAAGVELQAPKAGASITGETPCPPEDGSAERTTSFEQPPPRCIDPARDYRAEVRTSKGSFTIDLHADQAPETVNNFVVLARYDYYQGVPFHRIIPGFVVQGGDATGDPLGTGGPGYEIDDELPDEQRGEAYEVGSVAMANSGPDTNGSQFFVVTGEQGATLPPDYSRFGEVVEGMDVVRAIEDVGTSGGTPTERVVIEDVAVTER